MGMITDMKAREFLKLQVTAWCLANPSQTLVTKYANKQALMCSAGNCITAYGTA